MSCLYYQDDLVTLYHGDALATARTLGSESVDCIITSPPYFGLRDYGVDGQYGHEDSPNEYVDNMVNLFRELRRALAKDGTCWLNLGDSFSSNKSGETAIRGGVSRARKPLAQLPPKNLIGIPWRAALALQEDGWILRNSIIWFKPNSMPDSVNDRLSCTHENVFLFTRSQRYRFDLDAIRVPFSTDRSPSRKARKPNSGWKKNSVGRAYESPDDDRGKNPGDVWAISTVPFKGAHFATFPPELVRSCVRAGCKPGGTVLDPFSGSGTTGAVAIQEGRRYVGVDINKSYLDLSLRTRLLQPPLVGLLSEEETP